MVTEEATDLPLPTDTPIVQLRMEQFPLRNTETSYMSGRREENPH